MNHVEKPAFKKCNALNPKLNGDTLYIFISHSSTILNLFEYFCKIYSSKYNKKYTNKIHSYSLSFITKTSDRLMFDFNINMK